MTRLGEGELRSLRKLLRYPGTYVQRRVDSIVDIGSGHIEWSSRIQIELPLSPDEAPPASDAAVVSLGVFRKQRLPDMVVTDQDGAEVPVMARDEQVDALASALVARELSEANLKDPQIDMLLRGASDVIGGKPDTAKDALRTFERSARNCGLGPEAVGELTSSLQSFVDLTQVLVWGHAD